MVGRYCVVRPLAPADATALWAAFSLDTEGRDWTYLSDGPYAREDDFRQWVAHASHSHDPQFYAIGITGAGQPRHDAVGVASYLRITPVAGTIEMGHIHYSPRLQHTSAATEAMYLMMRGAFDLGYRRCEWKCDALNAPSRRAAQRLGFSFEGIFRQALVTKGRNRDTAWYACTDTDWPALRAAFERWLAPGNLDADGRQRQSLSSLTAPLLVSRG
jgi:RimJ/RimL family protein N-acetyltransferase